MRVLIICIFKNGKTGMAACTTTIAKYRRSGYENMAHVKTPCGTRYYFNIKTKSAAIYTQVPCGAAESKMCILQARRVMMILL